MMKITLSVSNFFYYKILQNSRMNITNLLTFTIRDIHKPLIFIKSHIMSMNLEKTEFREGRIHKFTSNSRKLFYHWANACFPNI